MKRKVLLSILAAGTVIAAATLSVNSVKADDGNYRPLVQQIAEKFNLDESEVEAVFEAVHEERMQEMQEKHRERLQEAVNDGVITEDQMNALIAKHEEMHANRVQNRQENREEHSEEMDAWFSENGIDHDALREYMGNEMGPKGKGMRMR